MTPVFFPPLHEGLWIGGRSEPSSDAKTLEIRSPGDGSLVGSVAAGTVADVDRAVNAASDAFQSWSKLTAYERERIIRQATAHVRTRADAIGLAMAREQGKPFKQSRSEVIGSCDTLDYFAAEGVRVEGYSSPTEASDLRSWVGYQPIGVCALITPWNYPVSLLSWKLGPALATGCTVVAKPPTPTPLSPLAFCRALSEGGIPAGVINVVTGSGALLGEALVQHPKVAKVAMTGSTATGKRILTAAAQSLKKVSLELGGHCPAVVCADADLDLAARMIVYKGFRNCGQSCSSINRVYVQASVHDELVARVRKIAEAMSIGDAVAEPDADLGPMTTEDGVRTVREHIRDAVAQGATIVCGGGKPAGAKYVQGRYFSPTILTGVTAQMRVISEETFGPLVPFVRFATLGEAITAANATAYGLVAYVFTRDLTATVTASEALEAGTVCVNNGAVNTNYGPYSGWKESGYGLELSRRAVFEYLKTKHTKIKI